MNIHIKLVKKWLADTASVSQQELENNADAAYAAAYWVKRYEELEQE